MQTNHPDTLTPEAAAMLHTYQLELTMLAQAHEDNTGQLKGLPPTDFALRHALFVALGILRSSRKKTQGGWSLITLHAEL